MQYKTKKHKIHTNTSMQGEMGPVISISYEHNHIIFCELILRQTIKLKQNEN